MNKTVALDIGSVCINLRHDLCLAKMNLRSLAELPPGFIPVCDKLETGKIEEAEWLKQISDFFQGRYSNYEIIDAFNLIIGSDMEGMYELIKEMTEDGYKFVFFSDTSAIHIRSFFMKSKIPPLVSGAIFSYEAGYKKPADGMYKAFEAQYGKPCLYIDDKQENIDGGIRHGWKSHRFTKTEKLREFLLAESL